MVIHERGSAHALRDLHEPPPSGRLGIVEVAQESAYQPAIHPPHEAIGAVPVCSQAWIKGRHAMTLLESARTRRRREPRHLVIQINDLLKGTE